MNNYNISDKCKINTNRDNDTFVGIQCQNGELSFSFPMGFSMPSNDKELRRDIVSVLDSIASTVNKKESELLRSSSDFSIEGFPLQAYFYLISDFFEHGYYRETEIRYAKNNRGKIHWGKTIKTQKPYIQNGNAVYLDFITRTSPINENELITLIHKYCVRESFEKVGWIFTSFVPERPQIVFNEKLFRLVVLDKMNQTFDDRKRRLFANILAIIDNKRYSENQKDYKFGTNRYEYVWEKMIDRVFGIKEKKEYFPQTYWLINGDRHDNSFLEPDSIMIHNDSIYILDAKYYKYGITSNPNDLPESSSINKQITYGEYIVSQEKLSGTAENKRNVYNAFIMPFTSTKEKYKNIGVALSEWKKNDYPYEQIQGILLDLNHLIELAKTNNRSEIGKLAETITMNIERGHNK